MNNKLFSFLRVVVSAFMKIFCPWSCSGAENVPKGPVVLCGNHTALGDPLYVVCSFLDGEQAHIMAKNEIMSWPLIGWLARKAGVIGVKRGKSDVTAIKESMRVLKDGEKLLLFPEGTRVKDGQKADARTGAAMLATRTGVPILPVYISPRKKGERVKVVFGIPYVPEFSGRKATPEDLHRITDDLMSRIHALGGEG